MKIAKFIIGLVLGIAILIIPLSQFQTSPVAPLQDLAVQLEGRKKPLDTVARETVAQIHGRTSYQADNGENLDYLNTYLSMWLNNRNWNEEPFILLSYRPLKEKVGLDPESKYFSFSELIRSDLGEFIKNIQQKQVAGIDLNRDEREALTIEDRLALTVETVGNDRLPLVPHPTDIKGAWVGITEANQYYDRDALLPIASSYDRLRQSYKNHPEYLASLGAIANDLHTQLEALSPDIYPEQATLAREVRFYNLHPFAKAWILYGLGFVVMLGVLLFSSFNFYETAIAIFGTGLAIHGYGFLERMQIAGRPPVTNMYESVIWVGFGISAIALLFEGIYRAKYYLLAAAPLSIVCLILADSLPAVLDPTIKPLVPVLRDNFWLSIHVPTITLSYASFALALGLGHIILGHYLFAPQATARIRSLSKWNYGVVQVGVLLLATGIILGGIWAHFAWGRFWGWDTKETWALIALMCYVVPLHGRLVGWLANFGMAVTSVVSFNAVLMAWYGVNFVLGTGLHSYGFGTGDSILTVAAFVGLDLLFVLVAAAKYKGWFKSAPQEELTITKEPELATTEK
ncbi:ABC-type transport system involved in cytochrome c biogenesis, permease component [Hyella patelloides LEGE 07179]|uniref:ABC-type transport system involved in cytochrome c biogenesis, permease component n=1 Tax=Hyella patelloides LEGE 07179 TaxID=945734 RepID=A0A563VZ53_9CYAN|nr:cytochrome c biogenesis protein CcsA [Hyella patelloides]VEP16734.1 ABC-type transport system involved in cytochrome c biogenesis, permease component [Hyella patelloides LEGE 07179]